MFGEVTEFITGLKMHIYSSLRRHFCWSYRSRGPLPVRELLAGYKKSSCRNVPNRQESVTFEVTDFEGALVSIFYADFHPRIGKRSGAWMTSYKSQQIRNGKNELCIKESEHKTTLHIVKVVESFDSKIL